ncbi:MAG TPA: MBOAT family protein, partial [Chthoniobacterales bacterium]|nr:MBOAT family protein [Chthoniobacterales bacterium]
LEPGAPLEEMDVLTSEGENIAGADAVIFLAQQIWWAWPVVLIAKLPGIHPVLERGYRWVAARRGCNPIACDLKGRRLPSHGIRKTAGWRQLLLDVFPGWIALIALPFSVLPLRDRLASWQFMWLIAAAIFFGCKWLTAWRAQAQSTEIKASRAFAYFFAWPGMDAEKFLSPSPARPRLDRLTPSPLSLINRRGWPALGKILQGTILLFGLARFVSPPLFAGWTGMVGMILILHFGLFQLLTIAWRSAGIIIEPIMDKPLHSKSVSEFWGRRWNTAFNWLAFDLVFRPIARRLGSCGSKSRRSPTLYFGTAVATLVAFLVSGLIHELVISLPARAGYGLPTAYFLLQGVGILLERAFPQIRGRLLTVLITAIPAFWLFHPPFVHHVILPFMKAIGAL